MPLIDVRCPKCNRSVAASPGDDVVIVPKQRLDPAAWYAPSCRYCGVKIQFIRSPDEGLGECYHYATVPENLS